VLCFEVALAPVVPSAIKASGIITSIATLQILDTGPSLRRLPANGPIGNEAVRLNSFERFCFARKAEVSFHAKAEVEECKLSAAAWPAGCLMAPKWR
jgi:hypothetical protein